jgi:thiol-disulfide isomerase/thioredoxin
VNLSRREWLQQAARGFAGFGGIAAVASATWMPMAYAGSRVAPQPAPPLRLPVEGHAGTFQTLEALAGRVVLLNFWATWCVPCLREFPALDALAKEFTPDGLTVLAINVEDADANAEVTAFITKTNPSFQVLRDADMALARAYRIPGMPAVLLVDRKGQLRWQHSGYEPGDENQYRRQVRLLLAESA